ncbi:MAG TPA: NADH-quinone oxidoreductase subunit NuoK [Dehalococcoidia bacterium]|jgi:NADH:ubiquinone oxidoreductase subunit K
MTIGVEHFLVVSAILFGIGLWIALSKRNAIMILMGIEIMLNAVNLSLVSFSRFIKSPNPITGHVFVIFILTVAASEASVALAMVVSVYRNRGTIDIDKIDLLKF